MNRPWPIHSGQGGPSVEIASPTAIISAPNITVQRVPKRSATRPITTPLARRIRPASASGERTGTERAPPASAAMSLSATAVIQAAPNAISMVTSAAMATCHDDTRLDRTMVRDCGNGRDPGWLPFYRLGAR